MDMGRGRAESYKKGVLKGFRRLLSFCAEQAERENPEVFSRWKSAPPLTSETDESSPALSEPAHSSEGPQGVPDQVHVLDIPQDLHSQVWRGTMESPDLWRMQPLDRQRCGPDSIPPPQQTAPALHWG